jgi:hypothetical protein
LTAEAGDAEVADGLQGAELWTDPVVTRTASGQETFDVVPLLRARITDPTAPIVLAWFPPITPADLTGRASHSDVVRRVWPQLPPFDEGDLVTFQERRRMRLEQGRLSSEDWSSMLGNLFTESSWRTERTLQDLVFLAHHDVLDPEVTVPVALLRLRADQLPLTTFSRSLGFLFERGALEAVWPVALAVAAAAAAEQRKPHGLAALLGCLAGYAPEVPVPHRVVPAELAAFAAESGRSKSHAAARDLVAVLRSTEGPTA